MQSKMNKQEIFRQKKRLSLSPMKLKVLSSQTTSFPKVCSRVWPMEEKTQDISNNAKNASQSELTHPYLSGNYPECIIAVYAKDAV
jgi:hypothetical protein